ncbi:hypothetical protein PMAYCL1PPCAC_33145, partial [Pristionchus mayeri]
LQLYEVRIHYVEEGDKSKPLLLLIHGFPEFWYSWRFQIRHFAKTHHVVAIDQRGYGESEKPREKEKYAPKILAKDVKELIEKLGHKKAILVGHDWGAAVSWFTTLTYPDVVEKLIVVNCPHPGANLRSMWKAKMQILKNSHLIFFQAPWIPEITLGFDDYQSLEFAFRSEWSGLKNKDNFTDEDLAAWKATFSKRGAFNAPVNFYRALPSSTTDVKDVMRKKAEPPVLIIWGEDDPFLVIECADLSKKLCRDGRVEYIPNASHWVQQDRPERVNELIEQFL